MSLKEESYTKKLRAESSGGSKGAPGMFFPGGGSGRCNGATIDRLKGGSRDLYRLSVQFLSFLCGFRELF